MSTDNPTVEREQPETHTQRPVAFRDYGVVPQKRCTRCGDVQDDDVAAVVGDDDGCVPACTNCTDYNNTRMAVQAALGLSATGNRERLD